MSEIKGGDKMSAYLKGLAGKVSNASVLKVGFLNGSTEDDGTPVATVAAANNFGTDKIPPRPFFSNMIANKEQAWGPELGKILSKQGYDARAALTIMGFRIGGQLINSIDQTNSPPLSEKTIKAKGFDKPLIDTGTMKQSLQGDGGFEVV